MKKLAIVLALAISGCSHQFYKNIDGVNAAIAITIPDEDVVKLQVIDYTSGNRTTVREPSTILHQYTSSANNSYLWGMIEVNEFRTNDIFVCSTNATERTVK